MVFAILGLMLLGTQVTLIRFSKHSLAWMNMFYQSRPCETGLRDSGCAQFHGACYAQTG